MGSAGGLADIRSKEACGVDGDVPHYSDHKAMLEAHPELDVVCVCTPNGFHAQQAIDAISNDCHVVIEKPMALTRADGEAVLHAALAKGKQVFCVMQNSLLSAFGLVARRHPERHHGGHSHGSGTVLLEPR